LYNSFIYAHKTIKSLLSIIQEYVSEEEEEEEEEYLSDFL
jgi:hypothetical protein